jgi:hypothetical protein
MPENVPTKLLQELCDFVNERVFVLNTIFLFMYIDFFPSISIIDT